MDELANKFMELFRGYEKVHGSYDIKDSPEPKPGSKRKGKATTWQKPYTVKHWVRHLTGELGLGIVPINEESKCYWGAIDIDRYDIDYLPVIDAIKDLPLWPIRSKSGGLQIYVFLSAPVPASTLKNKLNEIATALGFGGSEIFPKQNKIDLDRGDFGNWMNMPYFKCEATERYAYSPTGAGIPVQEFIERALLERVGLNQLKALKLGPPTTADDTEIQDGPPCLQHLTKMGFPAGAMNRGLFNLGIYYKKSHPDDWAKMIDEANQKWMAPGTAEEVAQIIRSLRKKDYEYTCNEQPICAHCDRATCESRKFGVGLGEGNLPTLSDLTKILSKPPMYFLCVNTQRVGAISADDLLSQTRFQKVVFEETGVVVPTIKGDRWKSLLQELSDNVVEVQVPDDSSAEGQLVEHLEIFVTGTRCTEEKELLLTGRVWQEGQDYYFRMRDFTEYLIKNRFNEFKAHEISGVLHRVGVEKKGVKVKGTFVNCWVVRDLQKLTKISAKPAGESPF
jgi:hypothetical protein